MLNCLGLDSTAVIVNEGDGVGDRKAWLEEQKARISMFHLPSYAPEYNPDEYLNSDLKNSITSKLQARNLEEIQTATEEFMAFLSEKPEHVAAYFEHEKVVEYQDDSMNDDTLN